MLNYLLKSFLSRFFKLEYNITIDDPYYVRIPINNAKTKFRKSQRPLPDNLSDNDLKILTTFKNRAYRYDMAFSFIGVPFGTAAFYQLIPIFGSIYTTWNSLKLLFMTRQLSNGFPPDLFMICILNILVDLLLGLIPIIGDLITVGYKANLRNYAMVRSHLFDISEYNSGLISKEQIRPNFFNRKIGWFKGDEPVEFRYLAKKGVERAKEINDKLLQIRQGLREKISVSPKSATTTALTD